MEAQASWVSPNVLLLSRVSELIQHLLASSGGGGQRGNNDGGYVSQSGVQPQGGQYQGPIQPGTYVLKNVRTGTVADLAGGGSNDGAPVIGYSFGGGNNQKWEFQPGQRGYVIKNAQSGTHAGWSNGLQTSQGTAVSGNSNRVEWEVRQSGQGYELSVPGSDLVLDLAEGSAEDGAKIVLWTRSGSDNQQWRLERA